MNTRKNFIPLNEGFVCEACNSQVPPARGTFRNHCPNCLASKHVDDTVPGDRQAICKGVMPAVNFEGTDPDKLDLIHCCNICQKISRNRVAQDDNRDKIFQIKS